MSPIFRNGFIHLFNWGHACFQQIWLLSSLTGKYCLTFNLLFFSCLGPLWRISWMFFVPKTMCTFYLWLLSPSGTTEQHYTFEQYLYKSLRCHPPPQTSDDSHNSLIVFVVSTASSCLKALVYLDRQKQMQLTSQRLHYEISTFSQVCSTVVLCREQQGLVREPVWRWIRCALLLL